MADIYGTWNTISYATLRATFNPRHNTVQSKIITPSTQQSTTQQTNYK